MTAASSDLDIDRRDGCLLGYPVAAATLLFTGALIALNASGEAVAATNATARTFVGVCNDQVDNSDGAAGDLDVEVRTTGEYLLTGSGFAAGDEGKAVYVVDDATVGLVGTSGSAHLRVGTLTAVVSATQAWVRIEPFGQAGDLRGLYGRKRLHKVRITGVNATAFNFATYAALWGASGLYVDAVIGGVSYLAADGTLVDGLLVATTDYTLSAGVLSTVGDETAKVWDLDLVARLY